MKRKYRIISKYFYLDEIEYIPQYRGRLGIWYNWNTYRYEYPQPTSFKTLCEAYQFIDKYKIADEYGVKIHPYPPEVI